jgi:hypothetical protein
MSNQQILNALENSIILLNMIQRMTDLSRRDTACKNIATILDNIKEALIEKAAVPAKNTTA